MRELRLLRAHGLAHGGFILVHPGSRWLFKAWTPQGNAQAIAHLAARGLTVVLTAAPDAREAALCDQILAAGSTRCIDLRGQLSLPELGAVIRQARLAKSPDPVAAAAREELAGKDLACWCGLCELHQDGKPLLEDCPYCERCHVDTLGKIANGVLP